MNAAIKCLLLALLPGVAAATSLVTSFEQRRVTLADFDRLPPQAALSRVAEAGGFRLVLECPAAAGPVSAKGVSGRLPVVLDRLTRAIGCTWSEQGGVVTVRAPLPAVVLPPPAVTEGGMPLKPTGLPEPAISAPLAPPSMPTLTLAPGDALTFALRDFLRTHNMNLVWGAGEGIATIPGHYTAATAEAVVDAVLKAHSLRGYYARSLQTVYVK